MASGKEQGRDNLKSFMAWVESRSNEDFRQIVHRGDLNRREIAIECGFGRSAVDQNPEIRKELADLEKRLRSEGVLPKKIETDSSPIRQPSDRKVEMDIQRGRQLETENALLRAEVSELKRKLSSFSILAEVFAETGRVPR